jgi:hypothetical protein
VLRLGSGAFASSVTSLLLLELERSSRFLSSLLVALLRSERILWSFCFLKWPNA